MNIEYSSEHLMVDTKDIECIICYSRYAHVTNEAMIISCGHTVCSSCLKKIKECPLCKTEILQNPTKNVLLSSLLERDSQVNKCATHKRPVELYCKQSKKLLCSQCLVEKFQDQFESIRKIESKMKEIKHTEEKVLKKKQESKKEIHEKINLGNQNLKRKLDDLYDEKLAYDFANQKKLRGIIDVFTFNEKDLCEHQLGLSKFEEHTKTLQENWKNNPEGIIAEQILSASLATKQANQFYNDSVKQISTSFADKEKGLEESLLDPQNILCESSKDFFNVISDSFQNIEFSSKLYPQIARNYLLNTLNEHGILANFNEIEDRIEIQKSPPRPFLKKFYPELYDCSIEKLDLSCHSISDSKFQVLCEILQSTHALSNLAISLKEPSSRQIDFISQLILSSKTLQKIACHMPLSIYFQENLKEYIKSLLGSKRVSSFFIECFSDRIFIDFQLAHTEETLEQFTAKFTGMNSIFAQILQDISFSLANITSLRKVNFSFGEEVWYDLFLQDLCLVMKQSHNLQELNLGFAKVDLFKNFGLSQQISHVIIHANQLKKVNLFLSGNELSEDEVFQNLFSSEQKPSTGHCLEEFSLTIMRCGDIEIEKIFYYLNHFPRLKKLNLKINRVDVAFGKIISFLLKVIQLKALVSFDFVCRDFRGLTLEEKKDLEVCKFRFSQEKTQFQIVFEELMAHHLPDYVDLVSEDEGEEQEEDEEDEEDGEEGQEGQEGPEGPERQDGQGQEGEEREEEEIEESEEEEAEAEESEESEEDEDYVGEDEEDGEEEIIEKS